MGLISSWHVYQTCLVKVALSGGGYKKNVIFLVLPSVCLKALFFTHFLPGKISTTYSYVHSQPQNNNKKNPRKLCKTNIQNIWQEGASFAGSNPDWTVTIF
jgi:hypothetical protein